MLWAGPLAILPMRLISTHFTNMVMHHLWPLGIGHAPGARSRRCCPPTVRSSSAAINVWFGFRDEAYRAAGAPRLPTSIAARPSARLLVAPARLPDGWRASVRRAESRYGSDHYPLVAAIDAPR
jgi:hypothetical protein